jgi:hypothetical protein
MYMLQGVQIGRLFTLGGCSENNRIGPIFWATFCHGTIYVLIMTKNGLGSILGDFFTNPSGHPDLPRLEWHALRQNKSFYKAFLFGVKTSLSTSLSALNIINSLQQ